MFNKCNYNVQRFAAILLEGRWGNFKFIFFFSRHWPLSKTFFYPPGPHFFFELCFVQKGP